jgi:hypothetical protein
MRNMLVVTPTCVTQTMVQALVEALGGYWNAESTLNQGVIERQGAVVYVSRSADLEPDYDPHEVARLTQLLGEKPQTVVDIHIGHTGGSEALAADVAHVIIERWGGLLDDNTGEFGASQRPSQPRPPKVAAPHRVSEDA